MSLSQTQQSYPLSDSDLFVLKQWMFQTAIDYVLLGVHATLSIAVLYLSVASGASLSNAKIATAFLAIMMLFVSLSVIIINTEFLILQIAMSGFNPPHLAKTISLETKLDITPNILIRLNYAIGDIIVVWRAWVLFPQSPAVKTGLSICLIGSFVGAFVDAGLIAKRLMIDLSDLGKATDALILVVPLCFTNFIATVLIGYKAWCHRQDIQNNLELTHRPLSKVQKILKLLVESSILYLAIWIGYGVAQLSDSGIELASQIYATIMPEITAVYPLFVILVVARENAKPDNVNNMSLSQSIRFASAQTARSEAEG
ncbi:hypothetical protein K435DRAFT_876759 [Dendrothele bispora CBS 962.96]|uniref:Family A G protein-coupled receptor-like protein n=1 Tax=Dendrothele bispora (strain CBS 962.96) TaxID=1314807 RepID=A0A4S8KRC8_DENBC|nr:hypothetical protein K435DRAFT_876759 [Dendrothele bispora CBS 962.96]